MRYEVKEIASLGHWEWDIVSGRLIWSDQVYQIFGHSHQQFEPSYEAFLDTIHPDNRENVRNSVVAALNEKMSYSIDHRIILPDGSVRFVHEQGRVFFQDDKPARMVGIVQYITDQKVTEKQLQIYTSELERNNEELRQFAYVASHDLQEPLRMISSYMKLLDKRYYDKLGDEAREFIDYAVDGAGRMRELIDDLQVYSRVGTPGTEFEKFNCEDALGNAVRNLEVAIDESGAVITHDRLPVVYGDESQILQLFQNLIANSIKFRSDKPKIHISAETGANGHIFSVRDNGIGIDKKFHEKIFIMFQRLHSNNEYPGTGLGLTLCKRIVERHGGEIWVESEENKGSVFKFTITDMT